MKQYITITELSVRKAVKALNKIQQLDYWTEQKVAPNVNDFDPLDSISTESFVIEPTKQIGFNMYATLFIEHV